MRNIESKAESDSIIFLNCLNIVLIILTLISCTKKNWLDEKPNQSLAVPATFKDFQALLDNSGIMNLNYPALGEIASDGHYITPTSYASRGNTEKNAYTWSKQFAYVNDPGWRQAFQNILYCNVVLEGLEKVRINSMAEQQSWNNIRGQALFQRSRCFFELSQIYAPQYNAASASIDLGIPLRLDSDINMPVIRSSVEQTYRQIINDLLIAKDLIDEIPLYKTRGSKPAVTALLARVYLSMEDYSSAGTYANYSIQLYDSLIDFNGINSSLNFPFPRFIPEVIFFSTLTNYNSLNASLLIDSSLFQLYDTNDLRRALFFRTNSNKTVTYRGSYNGASNPFNGLAVDELYLIRGECYARNMETTKALKDLNDLLRKRWKRINGISTYTDYIALNSEDALNKILEERRKELLLRGLRWSDLRRLNKDSRYTVTLKRIIGNEAFIIDPNSYKYTFPIPDDIIQQTGIQQNAGW